jgi:hypothetical protein
MNNMVGSGDIETCTRSSRVEHKYGCTLHEAKTVDHQLTLFYRCTSIDELCRNAEPSCQIIYQDIHHYGERCKDQRFLCLRNCLLKDLD